MRFPAFDIALNGSSSAWSVNGSEASEEVGEYLVDRTIEIDRGSHTTCQYCGCQLDVRTFRDVAEGNEHWHNDRSFEFLRCQNCAAWEFCGCEGGNKCMDARDNFLLSSVVARFVDALPDVCSDELAQYLRRHPEHWHEMNPVRFEKLVAAIFRANYSDAEVIHVGKPGDGGVDVIFVESNNRRWLIQVKRRERPKPSEGFSTLQSILGAMTLEGSRHGIVVTTADAFSFHARRAQEKAERLGYVIDLIDRGKLNRMIEPLLPRVPWRQIFKCPDLSWIAEDVQHHFWQPAHEDQMPLGAIAREAEVEQLRLDISEQDLSGS